jgi:hypothetical protein
VAELTGAACEIGETYKVVSDANKTVLLLYTTEIGGDFFMTQ